MREVCTVSIDVVSILLPFGCYSFLIRIIRIRLDDLDVEHRRPKSLQCHGSQRESGRLCQRRCSRPRGLQERAGQPPCDADVRVTLLAHPGASLGSNRRIGKVAGEDQPQSKDAHRPGSPGPLGLRKAKECSAPNESRGRLLVEGNRRAYSEDSLPVTPS
jgi:hypothetical protein